MTALRSSGIVQTPCHTIQCWFVSWRRCSQSGCLGILITMHWKRAKARLIFLQRRRRWLGLIMRLPARQKRKRLSYSKYRQGRYQRSLLPTNTLNTQMVQLNMMSWLIQETVELWLCFGILKQLPEGHTLKMLQERGTRGDDDEWC